MMYLNVVNSDIFRVNMQYGWLFPSIKVEGTVPKHSSVSLYYRRSLLLRYVTFSG